ncbi:unnamed protein product [Prorocentrum cordatum]|uniref:Uncharacterized protein n=1 Tax=Prorocentrum cordatum TaxID=2364126 RepID=A0ABN9XET3_9DINO|nr:unnamed protein product [Polarella glacialis]
MVDVGGAGGLPDRNRTAEEAPVPIVTGLEGSARPSDEALQHFALFSNIMENTRMAQADVYFGHVLFGLLLQRLGRRFALLKGAGMLEPASDAARMRAQLERSVADTPDAAAAAQFESFVAGLAAEPGAVESLRRALELSPATLAAARRHTSFVFGRGLREEIRWPLARASRASGGAGEGGAKVEHCSPFLLEAASCGELRMLSVGTEARERLTWDGVLLGALLHQAEASVDAEAADR